LAAYSPLAVDSLVQIAQRKALDILNTVGLSNSVLKLVERRHRVDKWIAYAGMITTVIVVYMFWRWTHWSYPIDPKQHTRISSYLEEMWRNKKWEDCASYVLPV